MGALATTRGDPTAHKEVAMGTVRYTVLDGEIVSENRNGVIRDYVPDALGSTVALLDNTQTITDTFSYFPSGTVASRTGTTATPFQFVGTKGYHADASGKTYVRARVLEPEKGRWLTEDPIGLAGAAKLYLRGFRSSWPNVPLALNYGYAENNPVTYRDPSGLAACQTNGGGTVVFPIIPVKIPPPPSKGAIIPRTCDLTTKLADCIECCIFNVGVDRRTCWILYAACLHEVASSRGDILDIIACQTEYNDCNMQAQAVEFGCGDRCHKRLAAR